jgi:hypothetical protein
MTSLKSGIIGIISFLAVVGFSTPATTYAWVGGDMVFSNIGNIYMPGYTVSSGVNSYPMSYGNPMFQQRQQNRNQQHGGWGWTSSTWPARSFDPLTESFPIYYDQYSYGGGYGGYGQPNFGYSPQPIGSRDLLGNELCNWGDYRGYPCSYDPHQWIYDPYTGDWY